MSEVRVNEKHDNELIREKFESAKVIIFLARPFNYFHFRRIYFGFGEGEGGVLAKDLLSLLGISPDSLGAIYASAGVDSMEKYNNLVCPREFDTLPSFPLSPPPFLELAKLIDKPIMVRRQDPQFPGMTYPRFTIFPDGKIVEDKE